MIEKDKNFEFFKLLEDVENFSHAYLFETNDIAKAYPLILKFAKKIICPHHYINDEECGECNICHLIDENNYDDFILINPETMAINKSELDKLFLSFSSKSINENGHRVYIIYGVERMSSYVSNKILKFLEEPEGNIHALLITQNSNMILPTIKSRCQHIRIKVDISLENQDESVAFKFLNGLFKNKLMMIAYENSYVLNWCDSKEKLVSFFQEIEDLIVQEIDYRYLNGKENNFATVKTNKLMKIISITDKLSKLVNVNANLNLLVDRYIIEIVEAVI